MDSKIIGKAMKLLREYNGFSQTNIAEFLNIDQSLVSKFENGSRNLQIDLIEKLAILLGCDLLSLENSNKIERKIKLSFRSNEMTNEDLKTIYDINRIALNCFFMTKLMKEFDCEG